MSIARVKTYEVCQRIEELTGENPLLYVSRPGDGQTRIVFIDTVCRSWEEAYGYAQTVLAEAEESE